ncbi:MAG: DUF63 family protein [Candidatus Heimdallarchaeota archaeon]|nr:MAG: DUF63 family protein [Candidatus Heimdallarchaeota archaeon]
MMQQNPIQDLLESIFKAIQTFFQEISDPVGFIETYFILEQGYNIYNTIVYTTIGILSILLIGKIIVKINQKGENRWGEYYIPVQMDSEFFVSILPYIFIGSTLRALQDIADQDKIISPYEFFKLRIFVTPYVYVITILLTLIVGLVSIILSQEYLKNTQRFFNWRITFFTIGIIIEIILFLPIPFLLTDLYFISGGIIILLLSGIFGLLFHLTANYLSRRYIPETPARREEVLAMITQMFDAFNTVIAIEFFNYEEKHYLPVILFDTPLGAWPFLIVKFGVVMLFIYAVRGVESEEIQKWLLWVVFLLGLATGTRDFLRLVTNT